MLILVIVVASALLQLKVVIIAQREVQNQPGACAAKRLFSYCLLSLQIPKTGKGKKGSTPVNKDRFIPKLFIRGDSVILVLRNPK